MTDSVATVQKLIDATNSGDLEALDSLFTEDVVVEFPQSNERIVGNANRRAVDAGIPNPPTVSAPKIQGEGDLIVVEAVLDYGEGPIPAVFVFSMREGLIEHETGYWPQPFPAAEWRAQWVEPIRP